MKKYTMIDKRTGKVALDENDVEMVVTGNDWLDRGPGWLLGRCESDKSGRYYIQVEEAI